MVSNEYDQWEKIAISTLVYVLLCDVWWSCSLVKCAKYGDVNELVRFFIMMLCLLSCACRNVRINVCGLLASFILDRKNYITLYDGSLNS